MENTRGYLPTLDMSIAREIRLKFEGIGVLLDDEALERKVNYYLYSISRSVKEGVQYFTAKELAWEEIS